MSSYVQRLDGRVQLTKFLLRSMRVWLIGLLIVGLIVSNIASLLSASFHSALFDALALPIRTLFPTHATKILKHSPTRVAQQRIEGLKARVAKASRGLAAAKARIRGVKTSLGKALTREAGLNQALAVTKRYLAISNERLVSANGAMAKTSNGVFKIEGTCCDTNAQVKGSEHGVFAARTVPFAGIALTLGVAAYDIKTDCDMLDELDTLGKEMGEVVGADRGKVCGLSLPNVLTYEGAKKEAEEAIAKLAIKSWWSAEAKKQDRQLGLDHAWRKLRSSICGWSKSWYECSAE